MAIRHGDDMELNKKKVLVTGSEGFIGSHLVERLIDEGCDIRAFVCYNFRNSWGWLDSLSKDRLKKIDVFSGDIRDPHGVKKSMEGIDVVFHLAALIGIPFSYHSPDLYVDTNIKGTLNILQAAKELGTKRIVHTSTSEVYGTAQSVPIKEGHPVSPQSPYAATKAGADFLALSFYTSFNLPVTVVRPFNTYGPRQSARAVIPTIITQILDNRVKIKLGSLFPTRDLTFVEDTAAGFIKAAESEKAIGDVINLGSSFEISIGDLVNLIAELIGVKIETEVDEIRQRPDKSEVGRLWADVNKAKQLLNWFPRHSLEDGLRKTIEWFKAHKNIYKSDLYNV